MNETKNNQKKDYPDIFDEDFEVTYDGPLPDFASCEDEKEQEEDFNTDKKKKDRREDSRRQNKRERKSRSRKGPNLLSPLKKTLQTGTSAVSKIIQLICKSATLILITVITLLMAVHFWTGHSAYGNLAKMIPEKNYVLAAYTGTALFLLLFELISFFWSMTGPRAAREKGRSFRTDTGRGMASFLLIGAGSYAASLFGSMIPQSPAPLSGFKGAVEVYGSLLPTLIPLCILGVISCILRKVFSK